MRVLVCGGRDYNDLTQLFWALDNIQPSLIINGGASGADALARRYAQKRGIAVETYQADWQAYGKAAGPIRNSKMLNDGQPDLVVACPGGRGTADMVRQAEVKGVEIKRIGAPL